MSIFECLKGICKAQDTFNPWKLMTEDVLYRYDNIVIVDKNKIVKSEDEEMKFSIVLRTDYGGSFCDSDDATVYYSAENGMIYGGIYEPKLNKCLTHTIFANPESPLDTYASYIFSRKDYDYFVNIINSI